jgi:hypothetical protein
MQRSGRLTRRRAVNSSWEVVGQNLTLVLEVIEERHVVVTDEQAVEVLTVINTRTRDTESSEDCIIIGAVFARVADVVHFAIHCVFCFH